MFTQLCSPLPIEKTFYLSIYQPSTENKYEGSTSVETEFEAFNSQPSISKNKWQNLIIDVDKWRQNW